MKYGILDPRKTEEAQKHNEGLLGEKTLGIEVTIPELAAGCGLGNIDPQHSGEKKQMSAIEFVVEKYQKWENMPEENTTMVTIRSDLDSIGAMALIEIFKDQHYQYMLYPGGTDSGIYAYYADFGIDEKMQEKIDKISKSDSFLNGSWQPYPLPTKDNPWPAKNASASDIEELAPMATAVADFKVPIENRVRWMIDWFLFEREPEGYRERVEKERAEMIEALETEKIKISTMLQVAVVESTHRTATMIGYSRSPVVVAVNPEFRFQGGEPHRKVTIAQFSNNYVDFKKVVDHLNKIESGWGGSQTIIGSPQGVSTEISVEKLVIVVNENSKP